MIPRLVATDLDGTLLGRDGTLSERSRRCLAEVGRCGVRLVLATGRPPRWMAAVVEATGHRGAAICANGAQLVDLATGAVLESCVLHPRLALWVARALRAVEPAASVAVEYADGGFGHEPGYRPRWPSPDAAVGAVEVLLAAGPVVKLLVRHEALDSEALHARAMAATAQLPVTFTYSGGTTSGGTTFGGGLLEVGAAGVTKGAALARFAAALGIPASAVLAFGDMPNDVEMLRWAGHGVAVAGAHPLALAAADEVTAAADEDGVAVVLERVLAGCRQSPHRSYR